MSAKKPPTTSNPGHTDQPGAACTHCLLHFLETIISARLLHVAMNTTVADMESDAFLCGTVDGYSRAVDLVKLVARGFADRSCAALEAESRALARQSLDEARDAAPGPSFPPDAN